MPTPVGVTGTKQLLVEGGDDLAFFQALTRYLHLGDIQLQRFGGVSELQAFLKALRLAPGFAAVAALGIVRDADRDPNSAFRSVQSALRNAGLPVPRTARTAAAGPPRIAVYLLPEPRTPGTLETLCLQAVAADPALACVDEYIKCVEQRLGSLPGHSDKARVHTFLASRSRPELHVGEAAAAGHWPWDDPCFDQVKQFLRTL
jgi:hypothetical protein